MATSQWTADEITAKASNWSLEGDAQILGFMEQISNNLAERTTETKRKISKMMIAGQETNIRLSNTHNKLQTLQHIRFVENRVYDEDETLSNRAEVPSISSDKNVPLTTIEAVTIALKNGVKVLNKLYDKVDLNLDDSDDEAMAIGDKKSTVFRPKDPYKDRPLPYLIGSREWKEKAHIGLIDTDDELSNDDVDEEYSESSDDVASITSPSLVSNPNDLDQFPWDKVSLTHDKSSAIQQHSDKSNYVPSSSVESIIKDTPTMVHSLVAGRETVLAHSNTNIFENKTTTKLSKVLKEEVQRISKEQSKHPPIFSVNLFSDEPPELDFPPIQSEKSAPINLFLDDDDDDDDNSIVDGYASKKSERTTTANVDKQIKMVPESIVPKSISKSNKTNDNAETIATKKTVNLFDDDDFDSFMNTLNNQTTTTKTKKSLDTAKIASIFDDTPPDDLFDILIAKKGRGTHIFDDIDSEGKTADTIKTNAINDKRTEESISKPKKQPLSNLFDDDFDDEYESMFGKSSKFHDQKRQATKIEQTIDDSNENPKNYTPPIEDNNNAKIDWKISENNPIKYPLEYDAVSEPSNVNEYEKSNQTLNQSRSTTIDDILKEPEAESFATDFKEESSFLIGTNKLDTIASIKPFDFSTAINLFDDVPPDDDADIVSINEPIGGNNIFDDFATDSDNGKTNPKSTINHIEYLFSDEPPPDDPREMLNVDVTDRSTESFQNKLSLFSNSDIMESSAASGESSVKPKPKKLTTNLNINVAALLPGAKLPSSKTLSIPIEESLLSKNIDTVDVKSDKPIVSESLNFSQDNIQDSTKDVRNNAEAINSSSERLVSLVKSRARIPITRRQSTRKGRQDQYRKSLALSEAENRNQPVLDSPKKYQASSTVAEENLTRKKTFIFYNDEDISTAEQIDSDAKLDKAFTDTTLTNTQVDSFKKQLDIQTKIVPTDRSVQLKNDQPRSKDTSKQLKKMTDVVPDDLSKYSDYENNNDIESNEFKQNTMKIDTKTRGLFDDSGDDQDDLFQNTTAIRKGNNSKMSTVRSAKESSKNTSLFSEDEDDDDDDIFGDKRRKQNQPIKHETKSSTMKSSGLFGDLSGDDDDDNELFGKSIESEINSIKPRNTKPITSNKSRLFDDLDDDDLFSTESKQQPNKLHKTREKTINRTESVKSAALNDPLADLLK